MHRHVLGCMGIPQLQHNCHTGPIASAGNSAPGATPMRQSLAGALVAVALLSSPAAAQTIYPIDRADILVGAKFDLKVEFPALAKPDALSVTVNGEDYAKTFGRDRKSVV